MGAARERLAAAGYIAGWKIVGALPAQVSARGAKWAADLVSDDGAGMDQLRRNLSRVVGPGNVTRELVRDATRSYARYWVEAFRLPRLAGEQLLDTQLTSGFVGREHLEAAIGAFRVHGRAALCGAISSYNSTEAPAGPKNMSNMVTRGLKMQGFTLGNYLYAAGDFNEQMSQWFADGKIVYDETIVDGIENTVDAFVNMMKGANIGKMLVRI